MAGHSKWANIQHRKKAQDAKRGKIFTKYTRAINVAAKKDPDPESNPTLRRIMTEALRDGMTRDTIERAIKRASGDNEGENFEAITYEGYGPNGVAVYVECLTDNRNRTVSEVRHAFTKCGGNLGTDGSVAYLFSKKGQFIFDKTLDENRVMEIALESGADDVVVADDGTIEVLTAFEQFDPVRQAFEQQSLIPLQAHITMIPSTIVSLDGENAEKMIRLTDILEDLDDVQNVYFNADISDEILAKLG